MLSHLSGGIVDICSYSVSGMEAGYCDEHVCMCVRQYASISHEPDSESRQISCARVARDGRMARSDAVLEYVAYRPVHRAHCAS